MRIALSYYKLLDHYLSFWEHLAHALLTHEDEISQPLRAYMRNACVYPHAIVTEGDGLSPRCKYCRHPRDAFKEGARNAIPTASS